jgi:TM2 domain-containing membrane protein YozV
MVNYNVEAAKREVSNVDKTWVIRDADQHLYRLGVRRATQGMPFAGEKSPARAYTYSLLFWGAGQSYSGQRIKGIFFQTCKFLFLAGTALFFLFENRVLSLLQEYGISYADAFLSAEILLFSVLMFWTFNAGDAYHAATNGRRIPFRGVSSRAIPVFCSLLVPGWGQFMNGQPVKGSILAGFSVVGFFSLLTIPAALACWPFLEPSESRTAIEAVFTITVLYAPFIPFIWLLSAYDALKISMDDTKKETLLDRVMVAVSRLRMEGWVRVIFPRVRSGVLQVLVIGLFVLAVNRYYAPANYLYTQLSGAEAWLQQQGMTLVPDLINRLLAGTVLAGK